MQARADSLGAPYGCLCVQASFINENVTRLDAELKRHSSHSFGLMNGALAWSSRKEQLLYEAFAIKLAGRSHAIGQRIRRMTIHIYTCAQDHGDVGRASIIRL